MSDQLDLDLSPKKSPDCLDVKCFSPNPKLISKKVDRSSPPKRRRIPTALLLPDQEELRAVRVKNTFIDNALPLSPSLEAFYQEREVRTCPSRQIGMLANLFKDVSRTFTQALGTPLNSPQLEDVQGVGETRAPSMTSFESPCNISTPNSDILYHDLPSYDCQQYNPSTPEIATFQQGMMAVTCINAAFQQDKLCLATSSTPDQLCPRRTVLNLVEALSPEGTLSSNRDGIQEADGKDHYHDFLATPLNVNAPSPTVVAEVLPQGELPAVLPPRNPAPHDPAPGTSELPSVGSAEHGQGAGNCKPCAFFHKKGCDNGLLCAFCHLCSPDELKRRRREKMETRRSSMKERGINARSEGGRTNAPQEQKK